jgi:hypothetical protein
MKEVTPVDWYRIVGRFELYESWGGVFALAVVLRCVVVVRFDYFTARANGTRPAPQAAQTIFLQPQLTVLLTCSWISPEILFNHSSAHATQRT